MLGTTCRWCEKNGGEKYVQLSVRCGVLSAPAIKMWVVGDFTSVSVFYCISYSSLCIVTNGVQDISE